MYQPYPLHAAFSQRLIVVANRLPVSASKKQDGNWQLQARPHTSDTVLSPTSILYNLQETPVSQGSICTNRLLLI